MIKISIMLTSTFTIDLLIYLLFSRAMVHHHNEWWEEVLQSERFPILGRLIKAVLSIFTGPTIEQSFSGMNDIVTKKTIGWQLAFSQLFEVSSLIYVLGKQTSFTRYRQRNYLRSPVNKRLCRKFISARDTYHKKLIVCRKTENSKGWKYKNSICG